MDKMQSTEKKIQFVELRAAGQSYRNIAAALNISKDTAMRWNRELAEEIKQFQRDQLAELVNAYEMDKAARVKRLGETIKKMDEAAAKIDFRQIDSVKLLQLRLTYMNAFQSESGARMAGAYDAPIDEGMTRAEVDELTAMAKAGTATVQEVERAATAAARFANSDRILTDAKESALYNSLF